MMTNLQNPSIPIRYRNPHRHQRRFLKSQAKRKVIRAGRRSGKTIGVAQLAVGAFLVGRRVLYAAPTTEQLDAFWKEVCRILQDAIDAKLIYKHEGKHVLEYGQARIRAKTAWNANTLRGDHADLLILDEYQLMAEDAWGVVGAPMLADRNGDAVFIYTPPSLANRGLSKAKDPAHASKLFKRAKAAMEKALEDGVKPRWEVFHFTSFQNPYISRLALDELSEDMTSTSYRMEILAEDLDESPDALWKRATLDALRILDEPGDLERIVVAVDPSATSTGDEAGIIVAGSRAHEGYVLEDCSLQGSPAKWASVAVDAYHRYKADRIIAEKNNGGEMVELTIKSVDPEVPVLLVTASRDKHTRAEPVSALYEKERVHHVGTFARLEDEMCLWTPGEKSPNRMDALVWAISGLNLRSNTRVGVW